MSDHPVPPPAQPPMAPEADVPPALVTFLYYVLRDLIPARYIDSILSHARANQAPMPDDDLRRLAMRMARELTYRPTEAPR